MSSFRSGLRLRLTVWYTTTMLVILGLSSAMTYKAVEANWRKSLFAQHEHDRDTVIAFLQFNPIGVGEMGLLPGDIMFLVEESDKVIYHSASMSRFLVDLSKDSAEFYSGGVWRDRTGFDYSMRSYNYGVPGQTKVITTAEDIMPMKRSLSQLASVLWGVLAGGATLAGAGGYLLAGNALKPLGKMADAALRITADKLSERLPVHNRSDELGRMALVFNGTLDRLEKSFAGMSAFSAEVSHELRTPLTAIRSVGEVALRSDRDASGYRDAIGSMLEEADRMSALVDDMLVLARADSGHSFLSESPEDLNALVRSAVDLLTVLAEEKGLDISLDLGPVVCGRLDESAMRRVFINVLDNAIRYSPSGGRVSVMTSNRDPKLAVIEVTDEAPPIPVDSRKTVFEKFLRLGPQGGSGGTGLGLAIAKRTVEAHGGRIAFVDCPRAGNRCRIELPII